MRKSTRDLCGLAMAGLLASASGLAGCSGAGLAYRGYHDEGGTGYSEDKMVYMSRPHDPKTVTLVDTRTGEPLWTMDVPVGRKLVVNFESGRAQGTPDRPDLMRWGLMDESDRMGRTHNAMPVPRANARRLDVSLRPTPEHSR